MGDPACKCLTSSNESQSANCRKRIDRSKEGSLANSSDCGISEETASLGDDTLNSSSSLLASPASNDVTDWLVSEFRAQSSGIYDVIELILSVLKVELR